MPFFGAARSVAAAVRTAFDAQGSFVAVNNVVSQSVPHLHVHVVPRTKGDGLRGFFWPRTKYADDAEAAEYAGKLRAALAGLLGAGGLPRDRVDRGGEVLGGAAAARPAGCRRSGCRPGLRSSIVKDARVKTSASFVCTARTVRKSATSDSRVIVVFT